ISNPTQTVSLKCSRWSRKACSDGAQRTSILVGITSFRNHHPARSILSNPYRRIIGAQFRAHVMEKILLRKPAIRREIRAGELVQPPHADSPARKVELPQRLQDPHVQRESGLKTVGE